MKLMTHQNIALEKSSGHDGFAFFMKQRMGKTFVATEFMKIRKAKKIIVIAPKGTFISWGDHFSKIGFTFTNLTKGNREKKILEEYQYYLCTYDIAINSKTIFSNSWDGVILDESSCIKNPKAKRTKGILRHYCGIDNRLILTGTPTDKNVFDYFTQMMFVCGGAFMGCSNFWRWQDIYSVSWGPFDRKIIGKNKVKVYAEINKHSISMTREEYGIGPTKVYKKVYGTLSQEIMHKQKDIIESWSVKGIETKCSLVVTSWLRRLVAGYLPGEEFEVWKYQGLVDLFNGEQLVVFFSYTHEIRRAHEILRTNGIMSTWITGKLSQDEFALRIRAFQKGERSVILCQVKSTKFGIDFSCANKVVYFSSPWSYIDRDQSEDRVIHPKKRGEVEIIDMITKETIDEVVIKALSKKIKNNSEFFKLVRKEIK